MRFALGVQSTSLSETETGGWYEETCWDCTYPITDTDGDGIGYCAMHIEKGREKWAAARTAWDQGLRYKQGVTDGKSLKGKRVGLQSLW